MSAVSNNFRVSPPKASAFGNTRTPATSNSSTDFANFLSPKVEKNEKKENSFSQPQLPKAEKSSLKPITEKSPGRISDAIEPKTPIEMKSGDPAVPQKLAVEKVNPVGREERDESVDDLGHRQALQKFLQKMKDQFGIDAEQVVEAFDQLTPQELEQPPELSLNKLLDVLPLAPEQKEQARAIFEDMLKQTAANGMSDYLTTSHRQLSLEVMSQAEMQKRQVEKSVDQMQNQFFAAQPKKISQAKGVEKYQAKDSTATALSQSALGQLPIAPPVAKATANSTGAAAAVSSEGIGSEDFETLSVTSPNAPNEGLDWQALGMSAVQDEDAEAIDLNELSDLKNESKDDSISSEGLKDSAPIAPKAIPLESKGAKETIQELPQFDVKAPVIDNTLKAQKHYSASAQATASASSAAAPKAINTPTKTESPQPVNALAPMNVSAKGADEDTSAQSDDKSGEQAKDFSQVRGAPAAKINAQEPFAINSKPTPTQEAGNIKEVINQAQFLARKGGGEMKVKLNPEGLGEVTMKVAVKSGQVSIEMTTQSNEAKKILEKGLGDLKANLMSHDLKVDLIKVDMPSDVSRQLTRNHDDGQRQFAQQFMEQFRQDNNEWRRGFTDIPGAKAYRSQKDDALTGLNDRSTDDKSKRASSRRLDLVA